METDLFIAFMMVHLKCYHVKDITKIDMKSYHNGSYIQTCSSKPESTEPGGSVANGCVVDLTILARDRKSLLRFAHHEKPLPTHGLRAAHRDNSGRY